jgi:hypothetical protein
MLDGTLIVTFDPPSIGFLIESEFGRKRGRWRHCSMDEIRAFLAELEEISLDQQWPPRECTLRMPGNYPKKTLEKFGLTEPL